MSRGNVIEWHYHVDHREQVVRLDGVDCLEYETDSYNQLRLVWIRPLKARRSVVEGVSWVIMLEEEGRYRRVY